MTCFWKPTLAFSIALVPSTTCKMGFHIYFWNITENKLCDEEMFMEHILFFISKIFVVDKPHFLRR